LTVFFFFFLLRQAERIVDLARIQDPLEVGNELGPLVASAGRVDEDHLPAAPRA
jgi:hypothetical protein